MAYLDYQEGIRRTLAAGRQREAEIMAELVAAGELLESPEVVVKIQLPNIERRFRADIKTIISFCQLAMPQHVPPMQEIEKQFLTEFDYKLEAANLAEVRGNILGARDRAGRRWDEVCTCCSVARSFYSMAVLFYCLVNDSTTQT